MIIACLIISSLALLAAVVNIILFFAEKKRDEARRQALLDYIGNRAENALGLAEEFTKDYTEAFVKEFFDREKELFNVENDKSFKFISDSLKGHREEIEKLKSGTVPNYEAALAAANAVNDFNAGISAIMNFDPIDAARKRRLGGEKEVS